MALQSPIKLSPQVRETDRRLAALSFHLLHELLSVLDGGLQLRDGFCYHLLFERGGLINAWILLDALCPQE